MTDDLITHVINPVLGTVYIEFFELQARLGAAFWLLRQLPISSLYILVLYLQRDADSGTAFMTYSK